MLVIEHVLKSGEVVHLVGWNKSSVIEFVRADGKLDYRILNTLNVRITNRLYELYSEFAACTRTSRKYNRFMIRLNYKSTRSFFVSYGQLAINRKFRFIHDAFKFALSVGDELNGIFFHETGRVGTIIYDRDSNIQHTKVDGISQRTVRRYTKMLDEKLK